MIDSERVCGTQFLPIREAARQTGLSTYFLRRNIKAGKIRHLDIGKRFYVRLSELDEDLQRMQKSTAESGGK